MPLRDELIQRAIQQLAASFARLLSRNADAAAAGQLESSGLPAAEAGALRAQLDQLYSSFMGSSAQLVLRLGSDDLIRVLGSAGFVDGERAYLLSSLLETEAQLLVTESGTASGGEALRSSGDEAVREGEAASAGDTAGASHGNGAVMAMRARALDLMLEAGLSGLGEPDIQARVDRLKAGVPPEARPPSTWERLIWFGFEAGDFAAAENELFEWLDEEQAAGGDVTRVSAVGSNLYGKLAAMDDATLTRGGLPRDELGEGSDELGRRLSV